jgi:methylamine utilization protein MauE
MSKLALPGAAAGYVLGGVLLLAASAKAMDPHGFADRLHDMSVPANLAYPGALAVVTFEAGLGAALLGGSRHSLVLLASTATFVMFVGIVTWQLAWPGETGSCGCFGQLFERTPRQALYEDVGFVALSGVAWLGRPRPRGLRWRPSLLGAVAALALAVCSPSLPLDNEVTALAPGATVEATQLDRIAPELRAGRHLVLLLDRAAPATRARIPDLNEHLQLPHGATPVVGFADDDPALAAAFLWAAGPAFEVHGAPTRLLRRLYRTLPRSALFDGGHVIATWTGFPADAVLDTLARGELP